MSSSRPTQPDFLLQPGQTLVCLGDSITAAEDGYVTLMANLVAAAYPERGIRVVNAGISGHKAPDMLARLERDVVRHRPDCVTVNVGINDVWHGYFDFSSQSAVAGGGGPDGVPLDVYRQTLHRLVRILKEKTSARVVLVTPTVIGEDAETHENRTLQAYVEAMRAIGQAEGLLVCPAREAFLDAIVRGRAARAAYALTTDGVHPNAVGHALLAITLLRTLGFFAGVRCEDIP